MTIICTFANKNQPAMLTSISPVDGRYHDKVAELSDYFSEFALIKYRVFVEIQYFIALCELPLPQLANFDRNRFTDLNRLCEIFDLDDAAEIKNIERITNHDVKAVEYFIKKKFDQLNINN